MARRRGGCLQANDGIMPLESRPSIMDVFMIAQPVLDAN